MRTFVTLFLLCLLASLPLSAFAGNLDAPVTPGSNMPTTSQIYNRLDTGAVIPAANTSVFTEPSAGPTVGSASTLADIGAKLPAPDNTNGAAATDVVSGKTFWGLRTGGTWGVKTGTLTLPIAASGAATVDKVLAGETFSNASGTGLTGTMPNNGAANFTPGTASQTIAAGYYNGSGTVAGDTNLVAGNIRTGVSIFGVAGTLSNIPSHRIVNKTGQTQCWNAIGTLLACVGTGQDGEYQYGIDPALTPTYGSTTASYNIPAFSGTRFIDNGNGTVTDTLTALVWLKNANCFSTQTWAAALTSANTLKGDNTQCSLNDGSTAGQWRLPNVNELHSLGPTWPPGAPFTAVKSLFYWSGSTYDAGNTALAWFVSMLDGYVNYVSKASNYYVWPVRAGQ